MKLNTFFVNITLLLLLLVIFSSCRTYDIFSDSENTDFILKNKSDKLSYFVKIDSINDNLIEGRYYLINGEMILQPKSFTLDMRKKKHKVETEDLRTFDFKVKKERNDIIEGVFKDRLLNKKKSFVLYPYKTKEYGFPEFGRYKNNLFEVERISDVNYAEAVGFWSSVPDDTIDIRSILKNSLSNSLNKRELNLDMDIYIPKDDTLSERPLLMLIHGGAFYIGDKASEAYRRWCTHFASMGYVCVSINYRMGFLPTAKSIERTAYQALQDAHAAMRFLVSKKNIYRIDTDNIFVGGSSAGGITALNLAFMRDKDRPESTKETLFYEDLGNIDASGNSLRNPFKIKAVANMWGSVYNLNILKNANASIISFHGDADPILPYDYGYPFETIGELNKILFSEMYGSYQIHKKAEELGMRSVLHTFEGEGHALHLDENRKLSKNFYTIQNEMTDFFYEELIPYPVFIVQDNYDMQSFYIDSTYVDEYEWYIDGGIVTENNDGKIRASWFEDESKHELKVRGYYRNGISFEDVFLIKEEVSR